MDIETIAFILLIIISLINPELIYNLNKFYIGKLIILIVIIFFSSSSIVLGLLTIFMFFLILNKYRYVIEGMINENPIITPNTVGETTEDNVDKNNTNKNNTNKNNTNKNNTIKKNKIIITTSSVNSDGIDIQDIRDSIASKDSNSFPLSKNMFKSTDDVEPFNIK